MTTIKIEFPADNKPIALALGRALIEIGSDGMSNEADNVRYMGEKFPPMPTTGYAPSDIKADSRVEISPQGVVNPEVVITGEPEDDDNTPADPNAPEHDAEGLIWDARIHASSKARNADDTWRLRRKPKEFDTDDDWQNYVDAVKVELRDGPAPAASTPQPEAPAPVAPPVAPPASEAPAPAPEADATFGDLMKLARDHEAMPRLNQMVGEMFPGTVVAQLAAPVGKDKLQPVYDALKAELNA